MFSTVYAEGRITCEEQDERLDEVTRARTFDDLVPITTDLVPLPVSPSIASAPVVAAPATAFSVHTL